MRHIRIAALLFLAVTLPGALLMWQQLSADALLRTVPLAGSAGAMALDDAAGMVLVPVAGTTRSQLYALDAGSGAVRRHDTISGWYPPLLAADDRGQTLGVDGSGRAFGVVSDRRGQRLVAFDPASGHMRVLLTTRAAQAWSVLPQLLLDERAGRLFVLNTQGNDRTADAWGWLPGGLRRLLPRPAPPASTNSSIGVIDAGS